ncbi:MAG: ATP-dependent RNA helicase RhlE [Bacteriovoracaceae bacterium]|jgi:ATP-dependent RNA helicase RhlE
MKTFQELDLLPSIKKALEEKGYTTPTPIQAKSIPHLLEGKDLLGIAQTGTGKTAAFSLPIINGIGKTFVKMKPKRTRVLILTPTRELASQIEINIKSYAKGLRLKTKVIFGGVGATPQINALKQGLDIVVATPGRLLDLMNTNHIVFDQLDTFVLDEADRMLDMGFIHDVKKIIAKLPPKKQTLLFSATMPKDIEKLAATLLHKPERVEVTPESSTVDKITQSVSMLTKDNKLHLLVKILKEEDIKSVLVFTRTKHGADKVVRKLEQSSIKAAAIHGNKSQNNRVRALDKFRSGELKVLIATDIAARGIDVEHISHVINFNLPEDPKSYVHRIGRTARAGREGIAISFCDAAEMGYLKTIEKHTKQKIPVNLDQPYHEEMTPVAPPKPGANRQGGGRNGGGRNGGGRQGAPKTGGKPSSNSRSGNKTSKKPTSKPGQKSAAPKSGNTITKKPARSFRRKVKKD